MQGASLKALRFILLPTMLLTNHAFAADSFSVFGNYEFNDTDVIRGIGLSAGYSHRNSAVRSEIVTSINMNEVIDQRGFDQEFYSWDIGFRLGYFRDVFFYIEAGVDVFDLALHDLRNDNDDSYYYDEGSDGIDGYAGIGVGIQTNQLRIEGVVKARQIDASNWEAEKTAFYGLQVSVMF